MSTKEANFKIGGPAQVQVHKFTLSSGKVIYLRKFKIKHQELSLKAADYGDDPSNAVLAVRAQNELLKILLAGVDDQDFNNKSCGDLDELFEPAEYRQAMKALEVVTGAREVGVKNDPLHEVVSSGSQ